jgi:hypothetical protein
MVGGAGAVVRVGQVQGLQVVFIVLCGCAGFDCMLLVGEVLGDQPESLAGGAEEEETSCFLFYVHQLVCFLRPQF